MRRSHDKALNLFAIGSVGVAVFALLLVTVLQNVVAGVGGAPMFRQPEIAFETAANNAKLVDVDGDLDLDLVTVAADTESEGFVDNGGVTVRLNDGAGNFGPYAAYASNFLATSLGVGDVDGDLDQDLVVMGQPNGDTQGFAMLNDGTGIFTEAASFDSSFGGNSGRNLQIVLADFDEDGNADLVVSTHGSTEGGPAYVHFGNGDGTFGTETLVPIPVVADIRDAEVADVNEDDNEDILGVSRNTFDVIVILGNGDGTFVEGVLYPVNSVHPFSLAIEDFNEDGDLDVAAGHHDTIATGGEIAVAVILGNGDGTFNAAVKYPIPVGEVYELIATDVDNNGDLDLVGLSSDFAAVFVMEGDGSGGFVYTGATQVNNTRPHFLAMGDADGDLNEDFVVAQHGDFNSPSEGVVVLHSESGSLRLDGPQKLVMPPNGFGNGAEEIASVDMDNDTDLDLVVANREARGISVSLNNGDGSFAEPSFYSSAPFGHAFSLAIDNFNGDTFKDVAFGAGGGATSVSGILYNDGAGGLAGLDFVFGVESFFAASGDFNEDSFQDVVFHVSDFPPPLVARIFFGDGAGAFPSTTDLTVDNYPCGLLVDDLDADTHLDIAFTQCDDNEVNIYFGDGSGAFGPMAVYSTPATPEDLKLANMDGDGIKDLVVVAATSIAILPGLGGGLFDTAVETTIPENVTGQFHRLAVGDVDGDGEQDVLLTQHMEGDRLMYFAGNGDFTFDGPESYHIGQSSTDVALGQFDGTAGLDAAVTDEAFSAVVLMHDGTDSFAGLRLGSFVESGYRWFANDDSPDVGVPLAAIDTPATLPYNGAAFRLRLLLRADDLERQRDDQQYKLQISPKSGSCDAAGIGEIYEDIPNEIGEKPDPEDVQIRYHDNESVGDSQDGGLFQNITPNTLDPRHGLTQVYRESYHDALGGLSCGKGCFFDPGVAADDLFNIREETVVPAETEAMWDFAIEDFSAPVDTYCVRAVREDGSPLDGYEQIAEFTTSDAEPPVDLAPYNQSAYRWFDTADSVTPGAPLAAQDTPFTLASAGASFRLRMLIHADDGPVNPGDEGFELQVAQRIGTCDAAAIGETYNDVTMGTVGIQYDDNPSVTDNDPTFPTFDDPTHNFDAVWTQTYNEDPGDGEAGIVTTIGDEEDGLWDFALVDADTTPGTTFCFRAITSDPDKDFSAYDQIAELTSFGSGGGGGGGGDTPFVERDAVTVLSPNGGERLPANAEALLTWDTTGRIDFVNLAYSIDGGRSWLNIARGAMNTGRFSWHVPDIDVPSVFFRVEATDLSEVFASDQSDRSFAIVGGHSDLVEVMVLGLRAFINTTTGCRSFAAGSFLQNQVSGEAEMLSSVCPGDFITTPSFRTVWYVTREFLRRPFFNAISFLTHQPNFQAVRIVTDATLLTLDLGNLMTPKAGTVLVKFHDAAEVYVLFENPADPLKPIARWLETEQAANANFGPDWDEYVIDLPTTMFDLFEYRSPIVGLEEIDRALLLRRVDLERVTNPFTFSVFNRVGEMIRGE